MGGEDLWILCQGGQLWGSLPGLGESLPSTSPPPWGVDRAKFPLNSRMLPGLITMMQINIYYTIIHLYNC